MMFIPNSQKEKIIDVLVKVKEQDGESLDFIPFERHYHVDSLKERIECGNSMCYGGGFEIGNIVRGMLNRNEFIYENKIYCRGQNSSKKGERKYGYCSHVFNISIEIKSK